MYQIRWNSWVLVVLDSCTVWLIEYKLRDHDMEAQIGFESERHGQEVMNEDIAQSVYDRLYDLYGNDIMMSCYVTKESSNELVRPRLRPEGLGNDG